MTGNRDTKLSSRRHLALLLACGIGVACARTYVSLSDGAPTNVDAEDYRELFSRWSREVKVIPLDGLENILTARATYLSPEFRAAYAARMADDLGMTAAERRALTEKETAAAEAGHEFYVTVMSGLKGLNDLDPEDGPWTIRLKTDAGLEAAPLSVEEVEKPQPNDLKYFGFDASQRKAYRLVFPKTAPDGEAILSSATRYFDLSFATAYGKNEARWETARADPEERRD